MEYRVLLFFCFMKIPTSLSIAQPGKLDAGFGANDKPHFRLGFLPCLFFALILLPLIGCSVKRSVPNDKMDNGTTIKVSSISDLKDVPFESKVLLELKNGASKQVRYMGVVTKEVESQSVDYVQWKSMRGSVPRTIPVDVISQIVILKRKKNGFLIHVIEGVIIFFEVLFGI